MQDWKRSTIYQIYPKSFRSARGGSTGDLAGVIEKLDYLQWLGVDYLWLTPIYVSPQRDNGYDVADYHAIDPRYGSMADFERLVAEAGARGLKIMMDIVVNHTSTDHAWFQAARQSRDNPYRDYYLWRDAPNNWQSKFGGPAWQYDERTGQYYLHLFDVSQADLNWENPAMRRDIHAMMRFWLDKGVAGFRLDVINLISKPPDFPEDDSDGRRFYTDGPRIHDHLQEMHREVFAGRDVLTVGEMSSTSLAHCIRYSHPDERELSMTFNFHHLKVDYPGGEKWVAVPYDFVALKRILSEWQEGMHLGCGWNAIFWCNHDQPRVVSRFGDDGRYRVQSAKLLATVLHGLQGTPYVYQGEEIGMANPGFGHIEQYRDVETLNAWRRLVTAGVPAETAMAAIRQKSRDNARTPMQWDAGAHGGFSSAEPWIGLAPDWCEVNVAAQRSDPDSVLHHYRHLIGLRKAYPVLVEGAYRCLSLDDPRIWAYLRQSSDALLLVVGNFSAETVRYTVPAGTVPDGATELLSANYPSPPPLAAQIPLRPYEAVMWHCRLSAG
ncbi:alpha,alpha-phosphotrehalase [Chitiniphilus purpureus]|uniref:Alpha,alpha-phosphotrehalase n=1 Tax=Chitiniphilus purpureus TaxID=2981137 RepID=A0ABY6DQE6_9NEIS|nr:alpha,alpha-phosphotrehalase [Chitiniphilus sp. CD1]UXY16262.1 alpha,alpha-phosphotrehalase [Chitiniphilus sp. CD1]